MLFVCILLSSKKHVFRKPPDKIGWNGFRGTEKRAVGSTCNLRLWIHTRNGMAFGFTLYVYIYTHRSTFSLKRIQTLCWHTFCSRFGLGFVSCATTAYRSLLAGTTIERWCVSERVLMHREFCCQRMENEIWCGVSTTTDSATNICVDNTYTHTYGSHFSYYICAVRWMTKLKAHQKHFSPVDMFGVSFVLRLNN